MTDQTVPVPVDLLKRAADLLVEGPGSLGSALRDLIPSPPKVGDVLTAEQINQLPNASVMRDEDGDVLVKVGAVVRRTTLNVNFFDRKEWESDEWQELTRTYTVILVSLPRD